MEYRKFYLRKLEILDISHVPPPVCSDGICGNVLGSVNNSKHLVLIYHDESIFHANESQKVAVGRRW